jgi:hypothetical protein
VRSHQRLKNKEAHDDGLDEKEDSVELMIALVTRDRSSDETCEIEQATDKVLRA